MPGERPVEDTFPPRIRLTTARLPSKDLLMLAEQLRNYQWVDLSHTLEEGIPAWPTHARFGHVLYESYELDNVARHYGLMMSEHTGTHMEAPLHFIAEGPAHYGIDEVPLDRLTGRAATITAPELPPAASLPPGTSRNGNRSTSRSSRAIRSSSATAGTRGGAPVPRERASSRTGQASVGTRPSTWSRRASPSWAATLWPSTPSAPRRTQPTTPCSATKCI
jgi:hypothetical protein